MHFNKNLYTLPHNVFVCCVWLSYYNTTISYTASIDVPLKWMRNVFLCTVNFSILSLKYEGPKMSEK